MVQCQKCCCCAAGDGPLPRQQGGLGRAGPAAARVKGGVGTAGVMLEEEKCTMNLFPVYDKNTLKQIFILIKNISIKGASENQQYPLYNSCITCANKICC